MFTIVLIHDNLVLLYTHLVLLDTKIVLLDTKCVTLDTNLVLLRRRIRTPDAYPLCLFCSSLSEVTSFVNSCFFCFRPRSGQRTAVSLHKSGPRGTAGSQHGPLSPGQAGRVHAADHRGESVEGGWDTADSLLLHDVARHD